MRWAATGETETPDQPSEEGAQALGRQKILLYELKGGKEVVVEVGGGWFEERRELG